jgi:hypothetical protein
MARKPKKVKKKKTQTFFDQEYGKKHSKTWKMKNALCRTWSIARKLKTMENETNKLQDVKYGKIH